MPVFLYVGFAGHKKRQKGNNAFYGSSKDVISKYSSELNKPDREDKG